MISFQSQIQTLSAQLKDLIAKKKEKYDIALGKYNSWKDINDFLNGLRAALKKMHTVLSKEEEEIHTLQKKLQSLTSMQVINTDSPSSQKQLVALVEVQSIVSENIGSEVNESIESITVYFNKLQEFVRRKLNRNWMPLERKHSENAKVSKVSRNKRNSAHSIAEHLCTLTCRRNNIQRKNNPLAEALELLSLENKYCTLCNESNSSIVTIECCGKMCAKCAKERLMKYSKDIIMNVFEAENKQGAMCACPIHKKRLKIELLQQIFSPKELEILSIRALKRQSKNMMKGISHPSICGRCKGAMNDHSGSVSICNKHKMCEFCYM